MTPGWRGSTSGRWSRAMTRGSRKAERGEAETHLETTAALTDQAKLRAMRKANAPQAESTNPGDIDARVARAEQQEAAFRKRAADLRSNAVDTYDKWQEADTRVRKL